MKMTNKHQKNTTKFGTLVATDCDGETKTFKNVKEVAAFFEVTTVAIYNALRFGRKVRGCTVKKEEM